MKAAMKALLIVATMIGAPLLASQAAWAVACPATTGAWAGLPTCTDQDKNYTFLGSDLPGTTGFTVGTVPSGTSALHTVALNFGVTLAPGTYFLDYNILITSLGPTFGAASLDTTVPGAGAGVTVTKDLFDIDGNPLFSLISVDGDAVGPTNFPAGLTFLHVEETFTVGGDGSVISGATNTYTELDFITVPEPASLILLGLGLAGLGLLRRKKKPEQV